jgi:tripartite-type tricarboxylate transporter receptor subunit TctC
MRTGFGPFVAAAWALALGAQEAHSATSFYEGKSIRIVVGASAGGGYDTYSRVIARHIGKHIPGKPTLVVENMPGAGTLIQRTTSIRSQGPMG